MSQQSDNAIIEDASPISEGHPESEERFLDAVSIEQACKTITRPRALLQVQQLVAKIRKDAQALKRFEISKSKMEAGTVSLLSESAVALPPERSVQVAPPKELLVLSEKETETPSSPPPVIVSTANSLKYTPIDRFAFDAGSYNSQFVTLYISLPGVGSVEKKYIKCDFTSTSFDLVVQNLNGKAMRLFKDNLHKDIDPGKSKHILKSDKIVVKLAKVKGEYGSFDHWTELSAKNKKAPGKKVDPQGSIMDLMKDMYNSGDDNMKKMIGETMMKQQRGELGKDPTNDFGKMNL